MNFIYKNAFNLEYVKELQDKSKKIDDEFGKIKELSYLSKNLYDEERIIFFLSGLVNNIDCLVVLTDKRMILIDKTLIFTIINLDEINLIKYEIKNSTGEIFISYNIKERVIKNLSRSTVKLFTNLVLDCIENNKKSNLKKAI